MGKLAASMFLDVYMREISGSCYMLVQIYSGGPGRNGGPALSQMRPYAGGAGTSAGSGRLAVSPRRRHLRDQRMGSG
ncbi:MAG: hypothetical protein ACLR0U_02675 [Enterocloster clostridioformis]